MERVKLTSYRKAGSKKALIILFAHQDIGKNDIVFNTTPISPS
jgi:hypothetical protein